MVTVNGIFNDIDESTYFSEVDNYKFYFSSLSYKNKFEARLAEYITTEEKKLELKFNTKIDAKLLLMFDLYKKLEKRGFRVENNSKVLKESPLFNLELII